MLSDAFRCCVGLGHDAGNLDTARRQLDHEQHGEARQPGTGPHFNGEEIRGREDVPVRGQELPSGRPLLPLGGRLDPVPP